MEGNLILLEIRVGVKLNSLNLFKAGKWAYQNCKCWTTLDKTWKNLRKNWIGKNFIATFENDHYFHKTSKQDRTRKNKLKKLSKVSKINGDIGKVMDMESKEIG